MVKLSAFFLLLCFCLPFSAFAEEPSLSEVFDCTENEALSYCFGVRVFVAPNASDDEAWVVDRDWIIEQIEVANQHFGTIGVGFQIVTVEDLEETEKEIESREDRDLLGRDRFSKGEVMVFFVGRLANVDEPGDIYGVHWRDREDRDRRWIIVSSVSGSAVFTHELGHFFGLPHSDEAISLMNKTPRAEPPFAERTFSESEFTKMAKRAKRYVRKKRLTQLKAGDE